jgi:hypothetical protein
MFMAICSSAISSVTTKIPRFRPSKRAPKGERVRFKIRERRLSALSGRCRKASLPPEEGGKVKFQPAYRCFVSFLAADFVYKPLLQHNPSARTPLDDIPGGPRGR